MVAVGKVDVGVKVVNERRGRGTDAGPAPPWACQWVVVAVVAVVVVLRDAAAHDPAATRGTGIGTGTGRATSRGREGGPMAPPHCHERRAAWRNSIFTARGWRVAGQNTGGGGHFTMAHKWRQKMCCTCSGPLPDWPPAAVPQQCQCQGAGPLQCTAVHVPTYSTTAGGGRTLSVPLWHSARASARASASASTSASASGPWQAGT